MNIAITGGGTGGHLSIAKAIKEELNKRGIKPIFIGSTYGQDRAWFEDDKGFSKCYFFDTSGVVNKKGLKKIFSLLNIFKYSLSCRQIFRLHDIDIVFSVGGYSSAPASFAAILFKKDLFIHEQNSIYGKLNKVLKNFSKAIFCSFDKNSPIKEYPIRDEVFKHSKIKADIKTVIFLGGSQGASFINSFALSVAKELRDRGIKIIHQCGKKEYEKLKEAYKKLDIKVDLFDFDKNLILKLKDADFAISRAGASTLWELCALATPTLFVPYPYAAGDHQYYNAKYLQDKNLAFVKREDQLKKEDLFLCLEKDLQSMSQKLKDEFKPHGAKKIVDYMLYFR